MGRLRDDGCRVCVGMLVLCLDLCLRMLACAADLQTVTALEVGLHRSMQVRRWRSFSARGQARLFAKLWIHSCLWTGVPSRCGVAHPWEIPQTHHVLLERRKQQEQMGLHAAICAHYKPRKLLDNPEPVHIVSSCGWGHLVQLCRRVVAPLSVYFSII